jgi:hypothetical protein
VQLRLIETLAPKHVHFFRHIQFSPICIGT